MTIEQRLEKLERQNKRQRIGLLVLAVALCGVVSMAATENKYPVFDTVRVKSILVSHSDKDRPVISISTDSDGNGTIDLWNKTDNKTITLGTDDYGNGEVGVWNRKGKGRTYDSQ